MATRRCILSTCSNLHFKAYIGTTSSLASSTIRQKCVRHVHFFSQGYVHYPIDILLVTPKSLSSPVQCYASERTRIYHLFHGSNSSSLDVLALHQGGYIWTLPPWCPCPRLPCYSTHSLHHLLLPSLPPCFWVALDFADHPFCLPVLHRICFDGVPPSTLNWLAYVVMVYIMSFLLCGHGLSLSCRRRVVHGENSLST